MKKIIKQVIIILLTAVISSTATYGYILSSNFSTETARKIIQDKYYGGVDMKRIKEGAIAGMVAALNDPNSSYIGSDYGYDSFTGELTGEFTGIGISIEKTQDNRNNIVKVYKNTPAEIAGIQTSDVIVEVDGKNVEYSSVTEIANQVRGEVGTIVNIKVERNGEFVVCNVKREVINIPSVFTKTFENYGYIQVTSFDEKTDEDFKKALEGFKDTEGVIVDLRNNTGGILDTAVNMADMLINEGVFVTTKYNDGEMVYKASGKQIYSKPLVVLVNGYSASASEFFAAAIKENDRGELVGVNTFGKGSIQATFRLPKNTGIHLTIGNFYSPEGNKIHKVGVAPDYEIENPEEYSETDIELIPLHKDLQLNKALELLKKKK